MVSFLFLTAVLTGYSGAEASPVSDLLSTLREIQTANLNKYEKGFLSATSSVVEDIVDDKGEHRAVSNIADVTLSWDGPSQYGEYKQKLLSTTNGIETSERDSGAFYIRDNRYARYSVPHSLVGINHANRVPKDPAFVVLPHEQWFRPGATWSQLLGGDPDYTKEMTLRHEIEQTGNLVKVRIKFFHPVNNEHLQTTTATFDLEQGGNVIEFASPPLAKNTGGQSGTYQWRQSAGGSWILSALKIVHYSLGGEKKPSKIKTLTIHEYEAVPRFDLKSLNLDTFKLPAGTKVHDMPGGKRYTVGPIQKKDEKMDLSSKLDQLAQGMKIRGFLVPN